MRKLIAFLHQQVTLPCWFIVLNMMFTICLVAVVLLIYKLDPGWLMNQLFH